LPKHLSWQEDRVGWSSCQNREGKYSAISGSGSGSGSPSSARKDLKIILSCWNKMVSHVPDQVKGLCPKLTPTHIKEEVSKLITLYNTIKLWVWQT